jgi:hypothetical protein
MFDIERNKQDESAWALILNKAVCTQLSSSLLLERLNTTIMIAPFYTLFRHESTSAGTQTQEGLTKGIVHLYCTFSGLDNGFRNETRKHFARINMQTKNIRKMKTNKLMYCIFHVVSFFQPFFLFSGYKNAKYTYDTYDFLAIVYSSVYVCICMLHLHINAYFIHIVKFYFHFFSFVLFSYFLLNFFTFYSTSLRCIVVYFENNNLILLFCQKQKNTARVSLCCFRTLSSFLVSKQKVHRRNSLQRILKRSEVQYNYTVCVMIYF